MNEAEGGEKEDSEEGDGSKKEFQRRVTRAESKILGI